MVMKKFVLAAIKELLEKAEEAKNALGESVNCQLSTADLDLHKPW